MNYTPLGNGDLALAALLILINGGLSWALDLGLGKRLLIAATRMVVQLTLVGLVLASLFALVSPWLTALVAAIMLLFAGHEIMRRQDRRFSGWWSYGIGTSSMSLAAVLVTLFALLTALRPDPWYDPRYAIPLLGMILGNTMTGVSLGLATLTQAVVQQRSAIEARLALGETRRVALLGPVRQSLKTALMPTINTMSATGVVALPGMMTGQILSGTAPADAVRYQILILFLICGGTGLGAMAAVFLGAARLTDHRHRLRLERLITR